MAITGATIGATDIALRAADKPILLGRNWQRESTAVDPQWVAGTGLWADPDLEDASFPTVRVYDEFDHLQSKPDTNMTTGYLLFNFGSTAGIIDSVAILNHNLGTLGATVKIQVGEDASYTTLKTLESQTPADDKRMVFLDFDDLAGGGQKRYSNVQYARIEFSGLSSTKPLIGEVIWSRRRQLKHKPEGAWDKSNFRSAIARNESGTGIMTDYVFHKNRRRVSMQLSPHETANIDDLTTFFETEIDGGTLPFILIDDPGSSPTDANWLKYETPEQIAPLIGFSQRSIPIVALEHGPNFLKNGT